MKHIEKLLGLTREKLIYLAQFLGSDYTLGIKNIGIINAMEIISTFESREGMERFKQWARMPDNLMEDA